MITANILDKDLPIDLRSDFEDIKLAQSNSKSDKKRLVAMADPLNLEELKERKVNKNIKIEEEFTGIASIHDVHSMTTDGEHIFGYKFNLGIIKMSIKDSDFGKILLKNPILIHTEVSIVYIDGKLFVRDSL